CGLQPAQRFEDDVQAYLMGSVRIGEVAGAIDLIRLQLPQQTDRQLDIAFAHRLFFDGPRFIERQVHEMDVLLREADIAAGGLGFATADQALDGPDLRRIDIARFFGLEITGGLIEDLRGFPAVDARQYLEAYGKVQEAGDEFVRDGDVARGLVSHMYVMSLVLQPHEGAAHRDDVVVGVRREDQATFWKRFRPLGVGGKVRAGLPPRPTGDAVAQEIEHLQVDLIGIAFFHQQIAEAIVVVIAVGEAEDRLAQLERHIDHRLADHRGSPYHVTRKPGRFETREFRGRNVVHDENDVIVLLQQGGRYLLGDIAFHRLPDDRRLQLSPGHEHDAFGPQNGADPHRDCESRHLRDILKIERIRDTRGVLQRNQPGMGIDAGARFVETDVAVVTDAQYLQIDAAGFFDHLLVLDAMLLDLVLSPLAVRDMTIGRIDVHLVEQLFLHEAVVALKGIVVDGIVFVEVESDNVPEAEPFVAVQPDQLGIQRLGRRASRQTEDGLLTLAFFFADERRDLLPDKTGAFFQ